MTSPRPHDLLRLAGVEDLVPEDAPAWVSAALHDTPWVVVRRAGAPTDCHAVGVRGRHRHQRYAMLAPRARVIDVVSPERIAGIRAWPIRGLPALQALRDVRASMNRLGIRWGPTGSVGFELVTGIAATTSESDLDIVLRWPTALGPVLNQLETLQRQVFSTAAARVDCQVETSVGAIALAELLSAGTHPTLVRMATGPRLTMLDLGL